MSALRRGWLAWREFSHSNGPAAAAPRARSKGFRFAAGWREPVLACIGIVTLLVLLWRIRTARAQTALPDYYGRALRALSRRGLTREPAVSARDFARAASGELPERAATAFSRLTESYLSERFGGRAPANPASDLRDLRRALRRANKRSRAQEPGSSSVSAA